MHNNAEYDIKSETKINAANLINKKRMSFQKIITTIVCIYIAIPIFVQAFGRELIYKKSGENDTIDTFSNESALIYLSSSFFGQIAYSLSSIMNSGFLIFPTFENSSTAAKIHKICMQDNGGFINTLVSLCISALLTAFISFIAVSTRITKYLKMMVKDIVLASMLITGLQIFAFGCYDFWVENNLPKLILISISISLTIGLLMIFKSSGNPFYMIIYLIGITIIMNSLRAFASNISFISSDFFTKYNLFSSGEIIALPIESFFSKIKTEEFNFKLILNNWMNIFSMAIYPLIPFIVNLPSYTSAINIDYNATREFFAFGASNLASSLFFYPTYLNCSGSILFNTCGNNTRMCSIIAAFAMLSLYFVIHYIRTYLPTFVISVVKLFIGMSFILSYAPMVFRTSYSDMVCIIIMVVIGVSFANPMLLVSIAALFTTFRSLIYSISILPCQRNIDITDDNGIVTCKAPEKVDYCNIHGLTEYLIRKKTDGIITTIDISDNSSIIKTRNTNIIIDLSSCRYIDFTANTKLRQALDIVKENGIHYCIRGQPSNFYKWLYSAEDFCIE